MAEDVGAEVEANFLQSLPLALVDGHGIAQSYRELEALKPDSSAIDLYFKAYSQDFDDRKTFAYHFDVNDMWRDASNDTYCTVHQSTVEVNISDKIIKTPSFKWRSWGGKPSTCTVFKNSTGTTSGISSSSEAILSELSWW